MIRHLLCIGLIATLLASISVAQDGSLRLLFLGDQGAHHPARRFAELAPVMHARGIDLTYSDDVAILNLETLNAFDGLVVYANIDRIEPAQATALLRYVASGKGFIPLHCATYCFRNSPEVVALMGAQFKRHGAGIVSTVRGDTNHPVIDGFDGFTSWDESYLHHLHNDRDRTVLEYRTGDPQAPGNDREPWTWVRTHGEGRVFYTAWGHDERTWKNPGFQNLVERGIRWACGDDPLRSGAGSGDLDQDQSRPPFVVPEMAKRADPLPSFEYVDVGPQIPNYSAGQGETLNRMQKALPSEESIRRFVTPTGFEVALVADESLLQGKPIAMNWDERGRLWVCETVDYPHDLSDDNRGRDRVRILEDTDGDGRADHSIVFAEGLSIPTAIAFHRGGAVIQNGAETLYLKDTTGDGKADHRSVLMSGWNMNDTHGGVSHFRNGLDNWIWAMQGYNDSRPVIDGVAQQSFRMGFFRFKLSQTDPPQVEQLEFIRSTTNNTWGLGISEEGLIFGSTANRQPSFFMPIPNRYYERVGGWAPRALAMISDTHLFQPITQRIRQVDHHGGYTAAAGHAVYTARTYPPQWWNRTAFVCGPTGKLVGTFVLEPDGASFRSNSPMNLIASDDEWSAPIMAEVGPDGNVWVIDWYNYIVQHNPTPQGFETGKGNAYLTDLRDKRFGRIYRVVYRGGEGLATPYPTILDRDDLGGLLAGLRHPSMVVRLSAQRLLVERAQVDCVDDLIALVADPSVDAIGLNTAAIHAVHVLAGLGQINDPTSAGFQAVIGALSHASGGVRRNAIGVLPDHPTAAKALIASEFWNDPEPQVVVAGLLALADMPSADPAIALARLVASDAVSDPQIRDAATAAGATHADAFLVALGVQAPRPSASQDAIAIARRVAEHFARSAPDVQDTFAVLRCVTQGDEGIRSAIIEGLLAGWPADHRLTLDPRAEADLKLAFSAADDRAKSDLIQLDIRFGSGALEVERSSIAERLCKELQSDRLPTSDRLAAASRLISIDPRNAEIFDAIAAEITPLASPELSKGFVDVISRSTADDAAERLVAMASKATPQLRDAIVQALLARPSMTGELLAAIERGELLASDLSALQRQNLSDHPDRRIRQRARNTLQLRGNLVSTDRKQIVDEKLPLTEVVGDPAAGKLVFAKNCATCHRYQGEGNVVGPDLTGMSVHPKAEWLIHILDPSRSVESNYRLYTVLTADGVVISGLLAAESLTSIEMVDAQAKRHTILRADIETLIPSAKSAMPEGLEQSLGDQGIVDLLEFLTQKGDHIPLPLDKVASVLTTQGMFYDRGNTSERLVFDDWGIKTVQGVPFLLIDPGVGHSPNAIMLHGPIGPFAPQLPKSVSVPCGTHARAIHLLGGVAGWAAKGPSQGGTSMIVRLHYADRQSEDHLLIDGQHIADYIGVFDVPQSSLAFELRGRQVRYLAIQPKREEIIESIELVKPDHRTAPIVLAITVEPIKLAGPIKLPGDGH